MNQIAHNTVGSERSYRLLSSFEIVSFPGFQRGRPYQQTRLKVLEAQTPVTKFSAKLKGCRNWNGHSYAEDHVEEWISRFPKALFPDRRVHVIASQNYAHLSEKIDLLLLDDHHQFHVIELKAERVARNRGVAPDQIWGQMNRYVDFLRRELVPLPGSLTDYYAQFSVHFLGSSRDLTTDLRQTFGESYFPVPSTPMILYRTFLTEGYDEYAVDYFRAYQKQGEGPIRLIYYRFFLDPRTAQHYIEFWEVPVSVK